MRNRIGLVNRVASFFAWISRLFSFIFYSLILGSVSSFFCAARHLRSLDFQQRNRQVFLGDAALPLRKSRSTWSEVTRWGKRIRWVQVGSLVASVKGEWHRTMELKRRILSGLTHRHATNFISFLLSSVFPPKNKCDVIFFFYFF